ncbi:MAG: NUDIX domain-containing protein [bacterium]|nr:NUDIX domain-containing protein [bacterium]
MPHIYKDIDLTASIYIVNDNKVLLIFHKKLQSWLPIGGHVELNEDAEEALMREIQEECGLKVTLLSPPLPNVPDTTDIKFLPVPSYFDIHGVGDGHRHMNLTYFGTSSTNEVVLAEKEHDAFRWFTAQEIGNPSWKIWPSVKFYAKEAIKKGVRPLFKFLIK